MNKSIVSILIIVLLIIGGIFFYNSYKSPTTPNKISQTEVEKMNVDLSAGPVVGTVKSETYGDYLTDAKGMTLYANANDKKLQGSCTADCLTEWKPFVYDNQKLTTFSDPLSKKLNIVKSADGSYQYAFGYKPLYYYLRDKNPGDINGNGLNNNKWGLVLISPLQLKK